jgi:NTP pyrophosphatase (non-canonical NTP hydrolase)
MTLDEYVAWAAGIGAKRYSRAPEGTELLELGLGFAGEVGEVAEVLTKWLRDDQPRPDRLADELGDVAYYWARLCAVTELVGSTLLAQSRAHVEWQRAGRAAGGLAPATVGLSLDEFAAWVLAVHGPHSPDPSDERSMWAIGLALAEDAGGVIDCVRKMIREGGGPRERLAGELGDVWRYWTRLCVAIDMRPTEILARSRAKIDDRLAKWPPPGRL